MEHIAAMLILVGCGASDTSCRELPAPAAAYETMEDCQSMLAPAIGAAAKPGTTVHAKCAYVDPAWFEEDVEITWDVEKGRLDVTVRSLAEEGVEVAAAAGSSVR